jgi:hypothetical protein
MERECVMARSARLPKRFPVGTRYVVEGRAGGKGLFLVSARYVVLPNGRRLDLPAKNVAVKCGCAAARRRGYRFPRQQAEHAARLGV